MFEYHLLLKTENWEHRSKINQSGLHVNGRDEKGKEYKRREKQLE